MSLDESQSILEGNFDFVLDDIICGGGGGSGSRHSADHQCHLCHQEFLAKSEFRSHLKLHGQQEAFLCSHCARSFTSSSKLWSHLCKVHFKTREGFRCSLCDNKAFKHAFNYHLHMLIHLEEQPEKCRFCSKAFRTKPSLRKHELIHTGHKAYPCPECNSKFKTKDELKQHSISHTTGKPYHCHFCPMSFKYHASLKRHEKKGRCKIGKHWCPTRSRKRKDSWAPDDSSPLSSSSSSSSQSESSQQALFCDVFLGWETTMASNNNNHPPYSSSSLMEPLFSF